MLNHEKRKKESQRITKIKPFINRYNWEGVNDPSEKDNWEKFEKNNLLIALNVLYVEKGKIYPSYVLMIPNGEGWHFLKIKNLSPLLKGITLKNNGDF